MIVTTGCTNNCVNGDILSKDKDPSTRLIIINITAVVGG